MSEVAICIQARSNNSRLPGKCLALINGKPMLDRVIEAVQRSADYINNGRQEINVAIALLVPTDDPLAKQYRSRIQVVEGPEMDVLARYEKAAQILKPDYIVRITSDCPLIPPFVITKHILNANRYNHDYVSNVHPDVRMAPDGWDCEVISRELLAWADKTATEPEDREHVTTIIRRNPPKWARRANILGHGEFSQLKLSVDTQEDLEFVRTYHTICSKKIEKAKNREFADGYFIL